VSQSTPFTTCCIAWACVIWCCAGRMIAT
jgi:hypothetical protein